MADADRDSDIGDDSPVSARSEGETSGEHSYESSDEGVARDSHHQLQDHPQDQTQTIPHLPIPHAPLMSHHTTNHQLNNIQINHQSVNHQIMNNHQINHHIRRNSPRPLDSSKVNRNSLPTSGGGTVTVRDDFEALKSSLHPHLSSLASLAQGTPITGPSSVFAVANAGPSGGFSYAPSAFLAPAPPPPPQPTGSASSTSSSEGSAAGWSFEEQYKQVRQLYEISDDPGRKEFLDDLFSFMQRRGTPINRLPIMAKSVLDLYELYNLVIARGGLVEVINKKLWQEIIKGLQLPSSITSAAFTLRTQYMKYLYAYECDKKNLSTQSELDAAIEGNKREGRRSSGQYEAQQAQAQAQAAALAMQQSSRGIPASIAQLPPHMQPLALAMAGGVPGVPRLPSLPPLPALPPHPSHVSPQEMEFRVREYMRFLQQQQSPRNSTESQESSEVNGHTMMSQGAALSALEVQRLALWSLYNNNSNSQPDLEPQREALNLSESPNSSISVKREVCRSPIPHVKRRALRPPSPAPCSSRSLSPPRAASPPAQRSPARATSPLGPHLHINGHSPVNGAAAFKITTRGDAASGDQQLDVSIEINGVTYAGVLFPSHHDDEDSQRHMIS